jgi:UDP-N-acetylmuramoylalanine--D-glutamate ligase
MNVTNPKPSQDVKGKNVLVVGLARTGVSLAKLLLRLGANVTISDHKSKAELVSWLEKIDGLNVQLDLGGHTPKMFLQQDLIVLSPGISPQLKIFEYARSRGVKVTGEFEFASTFVEEPVIAVTGTNGKSTISRLIKEMLDQAGIPTWLGGNYGEPLSEYVLSDKKAKVVVAEVSSFQLEHVETFTPKNIVFTNLAENHLDRYRSMHEYVNAKRRVFLNVNQSTTSVLNADDNAVVELARDPSVQRGRIFYFSRKPSLESQIMNIGGCVLIKDEMRVRRGPEIEYFSAKNAKMRGTHAAENIMAATLVAREHGASHEAIQRTIETFPGLPHRLEYVRKVGGVEFFNDSKATNVHAVMRALDAFDENVILIMGGKDTNLNFEPLKERIRRKVKNLILIGEAKERINRDVGDYSETFIIGTFEEAVLVAFQKSRIGDVVLLSPGCSSFDMFDSYVERGNYFKEIVNKFE